jgi:hypothetical protein
VVRIGVRIQEKAQKESVLLLVPRLVGKPAHSPLVNAFTTYSRRFLLTRLLLLQLAFT